MQRKGTHARERQACGARLKLKMGMPLSGWRRKASGVSSTSTVRRRSRPSRDRSCSEQGKAAACSQHNIPGGHTGPLRWGLRCLAPAIMHE